MKKTVLPSVTLLVFFLLTSIVINAQQPSSNKQSTSKSNSTAVKNNLVQNKDSDNPDGYTNSKFPYLNYKGIKDADVAKKEWVKDHPAEYRKMLGEAKSSNPSSATTKTIDLDPNKNRRLPANYDDSKTNINKK